MDKVPKAITYIDKLLVKLQESKRQLAALIKKDEADDTTRVDMLRDIKSVCLRIKNEQTDLGDIYDDIANVYLDIVMDQ